MVLLSAFVSASKLVDLVADNIAHLLFLLTDLDLHLAPKLLLLQPVQVADDLKSGLEDASGHESSKPTDHVHNSTSNEIYKA